MISNSIAGKGNTSTSINSQVLYIINIKCIMNNIYVLNEQMIETGAKELKFEKYK